MADFDDQQEGRPAIGARNGTGIAIGLIAGAQHGVIPAGTAPLAVALPLFGTIGQQRKLVIIGGRAMDALFGLHNERSTPIEIDKAARLGACVDEGDGALKTVVIALGISRCRFGRIDA
ncbi:hypothetical protein GCM10010873_16790 [Cypionkella aquatica]|uniref:Uncharacterized protein n=1 Tax=Cypionkella aquatica TaxID=1756042 RepID=A0AA37X1D7_9RHOB|nr:hypothetical protein GCM10010873_16790 [Cypionkella aquatica]